VERFGAFRDQLYQKVQADPSDPYLLMSLAKADVALGRKEEAMQEARRAMEMRPISEDAAVGPGMAVAFAVVCAWANQLDLAFEQLNIVIQVPSGLCLNYGNLKTNPEWARQARVTTLGWNPTGPDLLTDPRNMDYDLA
jgi:hypothetical protein